MIETPLSVIYGRGEFVLFLLEKQQQQQYNPPSLSAAEADEGHFSFDECTTVSNWWGWKLQLLKPIRHLVSESRPDRRATRDEDMCSGSGHSARRLRSPLGPGPLAPWRCGPLLLLRERPDIYTSWGRGRGGQDDTVAVQGEERDEEAQDAQGRQLAVAFQVLVGAKDRGREALTATQCTRSPRACVSRKFADGDATQQV